MSLEFRYAGIFWSAIYFVLLFPVFYGIRRFNKGPDGSAKAWFAVGTLGISYAVGYVAGNSTTSVAAVVAGGLVAAIASATSVILGLNAAKSPPIPEERETQEASGKARDQLDMFDARQRTCMVALGVFLVCLAVGELCGIMAGGRAKDNYNCIRDARASGMKPSEIQKSGLTTVGNVGAEVPLSLLQAPSQPSVSGNDPSVP